MCCLAQDVVNRADSSKSVYIPVDLPDCMRQLDSILAPENKKLIQSMEENELLPRTHLALGMWIRNNWGLWAGSRLATYFYKQGIQHPDDMSGMILCCYYHYVKGENVNYRQMLRKGRQQEKRWAKKLKKERQREDDDWEYIERYECNEMDFLSEEAIEAFLHLPFVADSVTGIKIYLRNYGDSIAEDLRLIEQSLNREPRRTPRKDELVSGAVDIYYERIPNGHVKSLEIKKCDKEKSKNQF
ncbi:MAG: hypothetical protein J5862_05150 [Bacteroidales bacterium]|nr:hypothetical protein [Bacteroidales bacterium]